MKSTLALISWVFLSGTFLRADEPPVEEPDNSDLPRYIHVSLSIFDVSEKIAKEIFESTASVADHSEALKKLKLHTGEDVVTVAQSAIPVLSGIVGKLNLTEKFDYPNITWAKDGQSFKIVQEQREFGSILEVEPVFADAVPEYVWLDYKLIHTPYMPKIEDVKISLSESGWLKPNVISCFNREFASPVVIRNRSSLMVGSFMIRGSKYA